MVVEVVGSVVAGSDAGLMLVAGGEMSAVGGIELAVPLVSPEPVMGVGVGATVVVALFGLLSCSEPQQDIETN